MAKNIDAMKAFIESADRLAKALGETNPRDDDFDTLLLRHERLCQNALRYMDIQERVSYFLSELDEIEIGETKEDGKITPIRVTAEEPVTNQEPIQESEPEPVQESEPEPVQEPEPEPVPEEKPAPAQTYTLNEVKTAFTAAAKSGIKVAEIINGVGFAKLSDVPADRYAELMDALEAKKAGG